MGLKKASACFLAMEKQAMEDGLFVDYEVITATPNYSAVTCIVSAKQGMRRIVRMAADKELPIAQQCAGYMALCDYYEKEMEGSDKSSGSTPAKEGAAAQTERKAPSGNGKGENGAGNAGAASTSPNTATDRNRQRGNASGTAGNTAQDRKDSQQQNTAGNGREADDFRVPVGKFKSRDDNWISDMVKSADGRKVLSMLCDVANPSDGVKELVMSAKAYIKRHNISLRE